MFCLNNRPFIPKKVLLDNFFNLFVGVDIYILWAINKRSDSRNIKIHLFLRDDASDNSSFLKRCIFETKVRIYIELTNKKVKKVLIKYIPN